MAIFGDCLLRRRVYWGEATVMQDELRKVLGSLFRRLTVTLFDHFQFNPTDEGEFRLHFLLQFQITRRPHAAFVRR
jgi:hypothetical protein